jgi:hypothetical protein
MDDSTEQRDALELAEYVGRALSGAEPVVAVGEVFVGRARAEPLRRQLTWSLGDPLDALREELERLPVSSRLALSRFSRSRPSMPRGTRPGGWCCS